ncbi:MAG: hypothetical protein ACD_79C00287G0018 [uncultured bacterium]|nr:MAG: hypothetical protein ACD_79C00287G0018 [uncultured bacterium]
MTNYKIIKIFGMHYSGIEDIYLSNPNHNILSYDDKRNFFRELKPLHFNNFSIYMNDLGNHCEDIIFDIKDLQTTWAKENNVNYSDINWKEDILIKQIEILKPDVVYFHDIAAMSHELRRSLKSLYPFIKLVIAFRGYPGYSKNLKDVDLILACTPRLKAEYERENIKAFLFYHSFDDELVITNNMNYKNEFVYTGSTGYDWGSGHFTRYWYLIELIKKTNIKLWVRENQKLEKMYEDYKNKFPKNFQYLKPITKMFPDRCQGPVFGKDMYEVLQNSKICLNIHTDMAIDCVGNMRMFEATGAGTCLLTDTGINMKDLFNENSEVVTYSSVDECIEKMNFLLNNEKIRQEIALNGKKRTLKDHTLKARCNQFDNEIQLLFKKK